MSPFLEEREIFVLVPFSFFFFLKNPRSSSTDHRQMMIDYEERRRLTKNQKESKNKRA
tara:strand:+ start:1823 stop:1996 length:174 start_codon:yes stop_codon:yes gene_type:complete